MTKETLKNKIREYGGSRDRFIVDEKYSQSLLAEIEAALDAGYREPEQAADIRKMVTPAGRIKA